MSSSTPTRKYSAGNGPRPGFHRQVNTLLDGHCDQYHGGHGGLGGHSYLHGRNSHGWPRPGFHRQVTAFFDGRKGRCGHNDDGGLIGQLVMVIFSDHDDQDGHVGLRPWFNAMSVLTNMIVVSKVDGNGDLGGHNYFGGHNDHISGLGG